MDFLRRLLSNIFFVKKIDEHYIIIFFGIKVGFKYKHKVVAPTITELGVTSQKRNPKIIISLTTFPARINHVHKTIATLLNQTMKPDEIVLWLADEQFLERDLPESLIELQKYGLTIKWCEDIRSFKKLVPTLREYPEDIIITVDDDFYYSRDLVENLYKEYEKNPKVIHANRAFVIKTKQNKELTLNSRKVIYDKTYKPSYLNEIMTGSGVIYPPHALHRNVFRDDIFMKVIPTNDDVWFWAMAVLNKTKIEVNRHGFSCPLLFVENTQDVGLCNINNGISEEGMHGGKGLNVMVQTYPELMDILSEELNEVK